MDTQVISEARSKTLGCKVKLSTYVQVSEIARQANISASDWLCSLIENALKNGNNSTLVTQSVTAKEEINAESNDKKQRKIPGYFETMDLSRFEEKYENELNDGTH